MSTALTTTRAIPLKAPVCGNRKRLRTRASRRSADSLWRPVLVWSERRHPRVSLEAIADVKHLLDDIGMTRAQALREAGKPF